MAEWLCSRAVLLGVVRISKMHKSGIGLVDEIWTASRYLTDIYAAETDKPVFTMGQAIVVKEDGIALNREDFGFAEDIPVPVQFRCYLQYRT